MVVNPQQGTGGSTITEPVQKSLLDLIRELTSIDAPPGFEEPVAQYMADFLVPFADSVEIDAMGNLVAELNSGADYRVAIDAHMDEVGLYVKGAERNGAIRFEKAGIIDDRVLLGREVNTILPSGTLRGAIGVKSRHLLSREEMDSVPSYKEMWIDIGAASIEEVSALGVQVGQGI